MSRALFVTDHGDRSVLQVRDHDLPAPEPDQVQVRVAASGVNFIDVYKRQGVYPMSTPFVAGEEAAGTVESVGSDVTGVSVGDRVAWVQYDGAHAELANVPASFVVPVPDDLDAQLAAASMLQGMTAHYLVRSTWPIEPGQIALVHAAAGGVGQLLVQMITALGAQVVATAGSQEKLEIARELGATHLINYREFDGHPEELAARVRDVAGRGVDVAYDGVGKATFDASLESLRPRGMLVLFGGASGQVPPFDLQQLNAHGSLFVTRPTLLSYIQDRDELSWRARDVFGALADGSLKLQIGGNYSLEDADSAYEALEGRHSTGKLILHPQAD